MTTALATPEKTALTLRPGATPLALIVQPAEKPWALVLVEYCRVLSRSQSQSEAV